MFGSTFLLIFGRGSTPTPAAAAWVLTVPADLTATAACPDPVQDLQAELVAKQHQAVVVSPVTLPAGFTLAGWAAFELAVRVDPKWPRLASTVPPPDPAGQGWAAALTVAGVVAGSTLGFDLPAAASAALPAGYRRCAFDVWGLGGAVGDTQLVPPTWLTVRPSVR